MDLLERLAVVADVGRRSQRVLVGIDGPDAAGKTTLADRVAVVLPGPTVRISVDDFLRPRAQRHQRGELSPEGYYRDSVDLEALVDGCLRPFRDGASHVGGTTVPIRATLIADGMFLLRPELQGFWTLSAYLRISEETCVRRARVRDVALFGSADEVERRYRARYLPGQALYRREADPEQVADVLIDNEDVTAPRILRWDVGYPARD